MFRSYLFVPADRDDRIAKALASAADAVILDLEDGVAEARKVLARRNAVSALTGVSALTPVTPDAPRPVFVRVNAVDTPHFVQDVAAVAGLPLTGIVLPKADLRAVTILDWLMAREGGGSLQIVPLVESVAGLAVVEAMAAASGRVRRVGFGAIDFCADAGIAAGPEADMELAHARSELVLASRRAGLDPPVDGVWTDLDDLDGLRRATRRARAFGFGGKMVIHPRQIEVVHEIFAPGEDERAWAERILAAWERARAAGEDGAFRLGDEMVDVAVVRRALQVLGRDAGAGP